MSPAATMPPDPVSSLHAEIRERLGVVPELFRRASPDVALHLWSVARSGYVDNALPPLFKERLVVYVSRFCSVGYPLARHVAFLLGRGATVEEALRLLALPLPRAGELDRHLARLDRSSGRVPAPETPEEEALLACAAHVFLHTSQAARCNAAIRRALDRRSVERIALLLTYARTIQDWVGMHPEIDLDEDVEALLARRPVLADAVLKGARCGEDREPTTTIPSDVRVQSHALLEAIVELIPTSVFVKDAEHLSFVLVNRANERLLGLSRGTQLGRTDYDFFPIEEAAFFQQKDREALASDDVIDIPEEPIHTPRGVRWLHTRKISVRDAEGRPTHLLGISSDITERKRVQDELVQAHALLESRVDERTAALRASEAEARRHHDELAAIYDAAPVGLCMLDPETRYLRLNERIAEIDGLPAEAHVGRTVREVVPGVADQVEAIVAEVIATGAPVVDVEVTGHTPAQPGVERTWLASYHPQRAEGRIVAVHVVAQEITERKRAEQLLLEHNRVLELIASGCALEGVLDSICRGLTRLTPGGRARIELAEGLGPAGRRTFAPDLPRAEAPAQCHSAPIPGDGASGAVILCFDEAREPREWERRLVEFGTHVASIALARDRSTAAVRRSEAMFRTLGEAVEDLLWMTDDGGRPVYRNPAWYGYCGMPPGEPLAGGLALHPDDVARYREHEAAALASGLPLRQEVRCRRHDGEYRWFLARSVPVKDAGGHIVRWVGTATDVHDVHVAREALKETDRRKDEFLATLAHELRNPLAPIRAALHLLASGQPGVVAEARAVMERQVRHMVVLIDDLLDVSRISSGKVVLRREPIAISSAVAQGVEGVRPLIDELGHRLIVAAPDEPLVVHGDPTRLAQVVGNLLTNAAKYTPPGGEVRVTAQRQGDEVVLTVADTGIGIPPAELERVFELFTQVDRSLERTSGGLGIGLSLVRGLVEMHGGTVSAWSAGEGRGSTFTVRLPILEGALPGAEEARPAARASGPHRVLVVDDNHDAAHLLADLVRLGGSEVRTAHDGVEALAVAEAFRPDLVLMDVAMPRMNGLEATRRLRAEPWGRTIHIVALSGWGQAEDRARSAEAGCDAHLVKPVDPQTIEELVASLPERSTEEA